MKVVSPVAIATAMLAQSSVAETDYPEWQAGTTYAAGQRCIRVATHRCYESVQAANTGHDPATRPDDTWWIDVGPTNRWAMFDQAVGSSTTGTGTVEVTLAPGSVGALAVLDTNADLVRVRVTVAGTQIYDRTLSTNVSGGVIADWYAYFFAPIGKVMTLTFLDLPSYADAQITVTATGPDPNGPVGIGTLLVGTVTELGLTEANPSVGILDFSVKSTDAYGITTVVERAWSKQMQLKALIDTAAVDGIQRTLAGLRARPALYLGEEGFDSLAVYGFFKAFSIDLALETVSYVSLTVEGLI